MTQATIPDTSGKKRVGILFVHGVGEQKRFEHLTGSAQQFAELMRQADQDAAVSIVDRTGDWPYPPGMPDPASGAPITLSLKSRHHDIEFECHEVWWADLGARSGLKDIITFWMWGLGQWGAPIYRELDAARLPKDGRDSFNRPVSSLATVPQSVAGHVILESVTRAELVMVAIAAAAIGCTWGLAKRLLKSFLDLAPSPTIIVQYLGDVRTYEERAAPGTSAITDPGFPLRVGIRRRMVTEMVAMADRGFDEWHVAAHSLGTVVAYNGLTEIGHTLPNYLSEQQWLTVSADLKSDSGCKLRDDTNAMMPARPAWLAFGDVINRPLLFRKLKGILTYGSPLNKFAALWPRVVATATDRKDDAARPFPDQCQWINLAAPADPVAGRLSCFPADRNDPFRDVVPQVRNISTPWTPAYGLAHILYFTGAESFVHNQAIMQKRTTMQWLMGAGSNNIRDLPGTLVGKFFEIWLAYWLIIAGLLVAATAAVTLGGGLLAALFGGSALKKYTAIAPFCQDVRFWLGPVTAAILWTILLLGQWRWLRESKLNINLAEADRTAGKGNSGASSAPTWNALAAMLKFQALAALLMLGASLLGGALLVIHAPPGERAWPLCGAAFSGFVCSILLQAVINMGARAG